jgi:hypothetical protein
MFVVPSHVTISLVVALAVLSLILLRMTLSSARDAFQKRNPGDHLLLFNRVLFPSDLRTLIAQAVADMKEEYEDAMRRDLRLTAFRVTLKYRLSILASIAMWRLWNVPTSGDERRSSRQKSRPGEISIYLMAFGSVASLNIHLCESACLPPKGGLAVKPTQGRPERHRHA